ncbi:hypothetical protein ACNOYE_19755 [Nannocystaceae bacterium ST9]
MFEFTQRSSRLRRLAGSIAFALCTWSSVASAEGPCPDDARYATNGAGQAFCLFEDMTLPDADVDPYCHWLEYGYIGFSWTASAQTEDYECPAGAYLSTNGAGLDFCIFGDLDLPEADALTPYCHYLDEGYIGYHWDMCPTEARFATNGAGLNFCLFEDLVLPDAEVDPYCHWLELGYIGFSWTESPATANYVCPSGSRQTDNGQGVGFCLYEDLWLPPAEDLADYCQYLDDGYIGYSWTD